MYLEKCLVLLYLGITELMRAENQEKAAILLEGDRQHIFSNRIR